jgi:hypothetical protein
LLDQLVRQANERAVKPAGQGGLLAALTKRLPESALEGAELNVVKEDFFMCAFCDSDLPAEWNIGAIAPRAQ